MYECMSEIMLLGGDHLKRAVALACSSQTRSEFWITCIEFAAVESYLHRFSMGLIVPDILCYVFRSDQKRSSTCHSAVFTVNILGVMLVHFCFILVPGERCQDAESARMETSSALSSRRLASTWPAAMVSWPARSQVHRFVDNTPNCWTSWLSCDFPAWCASRSFDAASSKQDPPGPERSFLRREPEPSQEAVD